VTAPDTEDQLTTAVAELAAQAERSKTPRVAETGRRCAQRLRAPLRLALVGRVSTGKSTLLNALLGTAVAPTDGRACTTVIYVFRHGRFTTASLIPRRDGERIPVPFQGSRLPTELQRPAPEIRFIDVTLPTPLLKRVTLIDTPGLVSANTDLSDVPIRMSEDTGESAAHADALLYCVNGPLTPDEADDIHAFRQGTGARRLTGGTAIGVLTRADQTGGDPQLASERAAEFAGIMSRRHADLFAAVVPVVGLLAETAETGALREGHARALGELVAAWSPEVIRFALFSHEMFLVEPGPVRHEMRRELLGLLGQYGLIKGLDHLRSGAPPHAPELTRVMRDLSGIVELRRHMTALLSRRVQVLKAARALEDLTESARQASDSSLFNIAQQMLDKPEMFPLQVIEMSRLIATNHVKLPARLHEQTRLIVDSWFNGQSELLPRATSAEAVRAVRDWRDWAQLTDLAGRKVAIVMVRAWQLAAEGHNE
jgi:hypothetical protein